MSAAVLLIPLGFLAFVATVWVGVGWSVTRLPFRPLMWFRRRRGRVISDLLPALRAGTLSYDEAQRRYEHAVGMEHLYGAFSHDRPDWSFTLFIEEWRKGEAERRGREYVPLDDLFGPLCPSGRI